MSFWGPFEALRPMAEFQFGTSDRTEPYASTIVERKNPTRQMLEDTFLRIVGQHPNIEALTDRGLLDAIVYHAIAHHSEQRRGEE